MSWVAPSLISAIISRGESQEGGRMGQHGYYSKDTRTTYGWRRLTCACHLPAVGLWPLHSPLCAFLFTCTMLSEWDLQGG